MILVHQEKGNYNLDQFFREKLSNYGWHSRDGYCGSLALLLVISGVEKHDPKYPMVTT